MTENEEGAIGLGRGEAEVAEEAYKPCVPSSWSLLEAIQALVEFANVVAPICVEEASRLPSEDVLIDEAMEEGVVAPASHERLQE